MRDRLAGLQNGPDGGALKAWAIVPGDTAIEPLPVGIYVGTGGNVTLRAVGSSVDVTYRNLPDGSYIAVRARFIRASSTAQNLIAEA